MHLYVADFTSTHASKARNKFLDQQSAEGPGLSVTQKMDDFFSLSDLPGRTLLHPHPSIKGSELWASSEHNCCYTYQSPAHRGSM